jgi:hypothetical protein
MRKGASGQTHASSRRIAIRLLFPGFILLGLSLFVVREIWGEPYPGLFMPAFAGTGLHMISPTDGIIFFPKVTVTFSDNSTADISVDRLFAGSPGSAHRIMLFDIAPNPDPPQSWRGIRGKLHEWVEHHVPGCREVTFNTAWTVPNDVQDYLHRNVLKLFPSRTPATLKISINRGVFPVSDFHRMTNTIVSEYTIRFHEGA